MDILYLHAALVGIAVGFLGQVTSTPRMHWVPYLLSIALSVFGLVVLLGVGQSGFWHGATVVVASVVASVLTGGLVWQEHPLLKDLGYWSRVWVVLRNPRMVRRTYTEQDVSAA